MAQESFKRVEWKYLLNDEQYEYVLEHVLHYMNVDKYSRKTGYYKICNIYYDTPEDLLIRRSLEKPLYKEKLRLRTYGTPGMDSTAFLEIKKKYAGIVYKRRITIPLSAAYDYLSGKDDLTGRSDVNLQVLKELDYFQKIYPLSPKVYLSYDRKALAGIEDPEFRVTFDENITTRRTDVELHKGDFGHKLSPKGVHLMEIKVLSAMPLWMARILSEAGAVKNSFSKYGTEFVQYLTGQGIGPEDAVFGYSVQGHGTAAGEEIQFEGVQYGQY